MSKPRKFRGRAVAPRVVPLDPNDPILLRDLIIDEADRRNAALPVFMEDVVLVMELGLEGTD